MSLGRDRTLYGWSLVLVLFGLIGVSWGQGTGQAVTPTEDDRGAVLRIQSMDGSARIVRVYGMEQAAKINDVLAEGDRLETETGRVELSTGNGLFVRVDRYSSVNVLALRPEERDGAQVLLQIRDGALFIDSQGLRYARSAVGVRVRVDTPDVSVWIEEPAVVRIDVSPESGTYVRVQSGQAELLHAHGNVPMGAGQAVLGVREDALPDPQPVRTFASDEFDTWNESRRQAFVRRPTEADYLPPELYYEGSELYQYGTWRRHPQYGYVWLPPLEGPWFPYTNGYWVWAGGWVWVPYEPWGWFTHHYGWWYFDWAWGWIWIPRPVFRFAWVVWYDLGPYVGWCPLTVFDRPLTIVSTHVQVHTFFPVSYWDAWGRPWVFVENRYLLGHPVVRYRVKDRLTAVQIPEHVVRPAPKPPWEIGLVGPDQVQRTGWRITGSRLEPTRPIPLVKARPRDGIVEPGGRVGPTSNRPIPRSPDTDRSPGRAYRPLPRPVPEPTWESPPFESRQTAPTRRPPNRPERDDRWDDRPHERRYPEPLPGPSDSWDRQTPRRGLPVPERSEPSRVYRPRPSWDVSTEPHRSEPPVEMYRSRPVPREAPAPREEGNPIHRLMEGIRQWTRPAPEPRAPEYRAPERVERPSGIRSAPSGGKQSSEPEHRGGSRPSSRPAGSTRPHGL
ncbi:MAG: hypothetical protein NZ742_00520 [Acidobacteria bacterium]|nr:hypothetical protein [Acidobacteriota bacterium]MDW7983281.1 hypothetical protein [Acidobacteriota bacterium]